MEGSKRLKKVNEEIESGLEEKDKLEVKLQQLKNQEKKIRRQQSEKERKKRNRRLIQRGAMLEKYIEGAEDLSNDQVSDILDKVFLNIDWTQEED